MFITASLGGSNFAAASVAAVLGAVAVYLGGERSPMRWRLLAATGCAVLGVGAAAALTARPLPVSVSVAAGAVPLICFILLYRFSAVSGRTTNVGGGLAGDEGSGKSTPEAHSSAGLPLRSPITLTAPSLEFEKYSGRMAAALLVASIVIGFPVTARAMLNEHIGNQQLQSGFNSLLHPDRFPPQEQWYRRLLVNDRVLADNLDRQRLPNGAVLMDTFNTWGVWLSSINPKQFIITSDYDFKAALNRPWHSGVKYLLASNPAIPDVDALNVRYPSLWSDGAGIAKLIYSINSATGEARFRLFEVTTPTNDRLGPPVRPESPPRTDFTPPP